MEQKKHFTGSTSEKFEDLIRSISGGDEIALRDLFFVSDEIIKTWSRHNKIETGWIAGNKGVLIYDQIIREIIMQYTETMTNNGNLSFVHFRDFLLNEFIKRLTSGFHTFLDLLKRNDQKAWKILFHDLERKAASWFFKRATAMKDEFRSIYCESVELIHRKLENSDLRFKDSSEFKSYFFRVLELKYLESARDGFSKRSTTLQEAGNNQNLFQPPEDNMEEKEDRLILEKALLILNSEERHILTDYYYFDRKLTEIAEEMNLPEGNIRIRKFRALQKLNTYLTNMGYGS